jgi:Anti-sigma-K factor rskA
VTGPALDRGHGEWDALAVGWAMTALDPDDELRFAEHLQTCGRCTATVGDALDTVADLAYTFPPESPPERLRRRILAVAEAEPRAEPSALRSAEPRSPRPTASAVVPLASRRRWARRSAVAATVALLAALGAWNVQLRSDQDRLRDVVAQRDALVARLTDAGPARVAIIRGPAGSGDRRATVVVKDGRVGLITETLPPESGGRTYWLWSLRGPDDAAPVPLAGFTVPETRFSACNIEPPAGVDVTRAFAISDEPGPKRPTRPTDVVAFGSTGPG